MKPHAGGALHRRESSPRTDFSPSAERWDELVSKYLHRRPTVIRGAHRAPLLAEPELLDALRFAVNAPKGGSKVETRRYSEDAILLTGRERWAPRRTEKTLDAYVERLSGELGHRIGLQVMEFQAAGGHEIFDRLREFLSGLYERVGVPVASNVELFTGNYLRTPIGVHLDNADVLCIVLKGTKRMRVWSPDAAPKQFAVEPPRDYRRHLRGSELLEGAEGDVLYWPASYWHVAESDGKPSASASVALWQTPGLFGTLVHTYLKNWRPTAEGSLHQRTLQLSRMPPGMLSQLRRELTSCAADFETNALRYWLNRISGSGFAVTPEPTSDALDLRDSVFVPKGYPIVFQRARSTLFVSGYGRSVELSYAPQLTALLRALNGGGKHAVRALVSRFSSSMRSRGTEYAVRPAILRELLQTLVRFGALRRVCS